VAVGERMIRHWWRGRSRPSLFPGLLSSTRCLALRFAFVLFFSPRFLWAL
jgi:hypothetical protein